MKFDSMLWTTAAICGALFSAACSSSSSSTVSKNGDAGGGAGGAVSGNGGTSGAGAGGATNGSGGKGGTSAGTGGGSADAGPDGSPGTDGGTGDGGVAGAPGRGFISVTQIAQFAGYDVSAGFTSYKGLPAGGAGASHGTCTTSGSCTGCVITTAAGDAGPLPTAQSGLDAGAIVVTGAGASKATLTYGPILHTSVSGYPSVSGTADFFTGGDSVSVTGAGGADLAAFSAQTVVAPSKIALTAPACGLAGCPDIDRTKDLAMTWTGGGAGKVTATLETLGPDAVTIVTCAFDASAGKGTIPHAVLALLEKAGDPNISGIEGFGVKSETNFTVGAIPTTFELSISIVQKGLTVSK